MAELVITSLHRGLVVLLLTVMPAVPSTAAASGIVELPVRPPAPALSLTDLQGRTHALADYRGRLLLVNFWAVWCGPCREEFPAMARAFEALAADGVAMVAVNSGDPRAAVADFESRHPLPFPVLLDDTSEAAGAWQVQGLPTTYVVTPDGEIYGGAIGARAWDDPALMATLRRLARRLGARSETNAGR